MLSSPACLISRRLPSSHRAALISSHGSHLAHRPLFTRLMRFLLMWSSKLLALWTNASSVGLCQYCRFWPHEKYWCERNGLCRFGPYRPLRALSLVRYYPNVAALACASSYLPDVPMPLRPKIWQCQYQVQLLHLKQQRAEAQRLFDALAQQSAAVCHVQHPPPPPPPPPTPSSPPTCSAMHVRAKVKDKLRMLPRHFLTFSPPAPCT